MTLVLVVDAVVVTAGLVVLALLALRLYRQVRELGREVAAAGDLIAGATDTLAGASAADTPGAAPSGPTRRN